MLRRSGLLTSALTLVVGLLVACSGSNGAQGPADEIQDPVADIPSGVERAHQAALGYLADRDPAHAPQPGLSWTSEIIDTQGLVGATHYRYRAGAWQMVIVVPIVAPDMTVYQIQLTNDETGFTWEGTVDKNGEVIEEAPPPATAQVQGWMGHVLSLPGGGDYVEFSPEGAGEMGIVGASQPIEDRIVGLRDKTGAGEYANFWGDIECGVDDLNQCRLSVERLRVGPEQSEPEPVDAWVGRVVSQSPGAQFDDAFVLSGDYPVWFGVASQIGADGWPTYDQALVDLRDTGADVTVWGDLLCGVPDANGCQIQVARMEVEGEPVDPYSGWETYVNGIFGFSFRYPGDWSLEEIPAGVTPATESMPASGPAIHLTKDDYLVYLGFRQLTQTFFLGGTGMPAGEFQDRGQVPFAGGTMRKQALVLDGKDKVLVYGPYEGANLVVLARVDSRGQTDYQQAEIPMEVQFAVDRILGSFEVSPP